MITSICRHAKWSSGSITVGRGANKHLSAQATAAHNDALPFDYDFPFSKPSLIENAGIPLPRSHRTAKKSPARARPDASLLHDEDVEQNPDEPPRGEVLRELAIREQDAELQTQQPTAVEQALRQPSPGQVHVLGSDPRGTFVAHALSSYSALPPVRLLIHDPDIMRAWRKEGERLAVCRSSEWNTCDHAVAEWVGKQGWKPKMEHINHLVVSLPSVAAIKAIASIRHRLDHRTTICLLQDGLGLIEAINTWCFPDPRTRPTYILGHMTHSLGYHTGYHHAALLLKPRKLYLHAVGRNSNWPSRVKYHPPIERQKRATDFLRIMTTAPGLNAEGSTLQNFLLKKLPTIVAKSAVDPVTVVLECSFAEVLESPYGMRLVNQLLDEIYSVIMSLPELPNASKLVKNISRKKLWGDVQGRLRAKGNSQGYMLNSIRKGEMVDIPFLNGWFVKKGEETGIKCPANRMVIDMVKAKRRKYAADQQAGDVQFEEL